MFLFAQLRNRYRELGKIFCFVYWFSPKHTDNARLLQNSKIGETINLMMNYGGVTIYIFTVIFIL